MFNFLVTKLGATDFSRFLLWRRWFLSANTFLNIYNLLTLSIYANKIKFFLRSWNVMERKQLDSPKKEEGILIVLQFYCSTFRRLVESELARMTRFSNRVKKSRAGKVINAWIDARQFMMNGRCNFLLILIQNFIVQ